VVHHQPADHGAADAGRREHDGEVGLVARPVQRRHDLADLRLRQHHQAAAAQALQHAGRDQHAHRVREAARQRAERKHADRAEQRVAASQPIAQAPVHRRHHGGRQQVADCDPRGVAEVAELGSDARRGGGQQGLVDRRQEHRQHHRAEQRQNLLARWRGRGRVRSGAAVESG
jgi:hypothetical protein